MARRCRTIPGVIAVALLAACARTSIPGLAVHTDPSAGAPVVANIPESGTPVRVQCWVRGDPVSDDPVWYRIASPQQGWVTNYYVSSNGDHANAPSC